MFKNFPHSYNHHQSNEKTSNKLYTLHGSTIINSVRKKKQEKYSHDGQGCRMAA